MKFTSATWDNKDEGFFYTKVSRNQDNNEYTRIFYHKMGKPVEKDELVYQNLNEPDASYSLQLSADNKFLILTTTRGTEKATLKHFMDIGDMGKF